ncbi:hypothetical protein ACQCSX_04510 [Pseudarthrobacter sp. P1]|uniref:hypothetical protein n=1 Tax=Pseudarthrobacter sp. P1 TaxID=3418418 RepID=UPI003CE97389
MDQLALVITALLTVASPLAIAWVKDPSWSKVAKVAVPVVVSVVIGLGYAISTGAFQTGADTLGVILGVYGAQQLAYTTIMRWWATVLEQRGQQPAADDEPEHRAVEETLPKAN